MCAPLPTSLRKSIVTVTPIDDVVSFKDIVMDPKTLTVISESAYRKIKVSWDPVMGAAFYNVYGSLTPITRNKLNEVPIKDTSFTFIVPVIPQTLSYFFWVSRVNAIGGETFLSEEPATDQTSSVIRNNFDVNPLTPILGLPVTGVLNKHMKDIIIPQMHQRAQFELENDGEDAWVFARRFSGTPCPCNRPDPNSKPGTPTGDGEILLSNSLGARVDDFGQKADSDYQGTGRCIICFGSGIIGGYFPSFKIKFRYGAAPVQTMIRQRYGYQVVHSAGSWTLWSPKLSKWDILVREKDGTRFSIDTQAQSEIRGLVLHQDLNLVAIPITDIRTQVQDDLILKATHEKEFLGAGLHIFG